MCCERHVLARSRRPRAAPNGRILCYHSIGTPRWGVNDVPPARFRRQLELALKWGYRFVPAATIAAGKGEARDLAITFDDGLRTVSTNAAPVLEELRVPWSLFVVTDWADGKASWWADGLLLDWREIEALARRGATIASHSVTHPTFGALTPEAAASELQMSRRAIRDHLGIDTREFAIPVGRRKDWPAHAQAAARDAGYDIIYAGTEDLRPENTVARTFVTRFDSDRLFRAALGGAFDGWEEWLWDRRPPAGHA
jgi:peptidoglycan/xylan/chitin deacetylase (PgdA/CDA1 family)